ncbi:MAG: DUF1289 domain-containing protein [Rhodobacteraceae bacterium]|nr:DUF1289 domain-containing protein [Paracoccaceae bacterium]
MNESVWVRDEPDSPCRQICVIHPEHRLCIGCFRKPDEVGMWAQFTPEQRKSILAELPARGKALRRRRGGRRRGQRRRASRRKG